jgi:AP2 domain/HNH endonuclease
MVKHIELTQGKIAVVDDADYDSLCQHSWYYYKYAKENTGYAARMQWQPDKQYQRKVLMHREIMGDPPGQQIDHRDGDGLNNTRANLRIVSKHENNYNRRPNRQASSIYKGVYRRGQRWKAQIRVNGRGIQLGTFSDERQAARAYDDAARQYQGQFAYLNFPEEHGEHK